MTKDTISVPVLIIGFNRPDVIRQSLEKLRESKPRNMYFAVDGAREGKEGEAELVKQVKSIIATSVDWDCSKHYKYSDSNIGCEINVSTAITWVLEDNDYVIVLEDDIIAPYSFLAFAQDMLKRYKDEETVYMVSGDNFTPLPHEGKPDFYVSMYGDTWGWATWKRSWAKFDLNISDADETLRFLKNGTLSIEHYKKYDYDYLKYLATKIARNGIGKTTWDYVWDYIKFRDGGLSIVPAEHITSNIGAYGYHAHGQTENHFRPFSETFKVDSIPTSLDRDYEYDKYHYDEYLRPSFVVRLARMIKYMLE